MKKIYSKFRIGLMAFALGLAGVYMTERFPSAPYVELPTAVSTDVFHVFPANTHFFTREMNCGKDPADAQARLDCVNEKVFENRDISLYARYDIVCDPSGSDSRSICGPNDERMQHEVVLRHWKERTRAHMVIHFIGRNRTWKSHYFIEPAGDQLWQLTYTGEDSGSFFIDGERTLVTIVEPHWFYKQAHWKIATRTDGPYDLTPGTRYLQFENETGDTVSF